MKITRPILAALSCLASAFAGTMTVDSVAPAVDGADIAQLIGTTDIGGNQGHAWSNRPRQGQSFTTGAASGGYFLTAITQRVRVDQASTTAGNWELRVGTLDGGAVFTAAVTENIPGVTIPNSVAGNDFPAWVTWTLDVPLLLTPNTVYAYDVFPNGGGYISLGDPGNVLAGGSAYSAGSPGSAVYPDSPPNPVTNHASDRVFHLDLAVDVADDIDGDGLPDQWETDNGLDPDDNGENPNNNGVPGNPDNGASGDPDLDGSDNANEFLNGTDPQDEDTDDDTLLDGVESNSRVFVDANDTGSNPNDPDTDGDTLDDFSEVEPNPFVTDPNRADTDGDTLDDASELAANPFETDPTKADTDGDGFDDGVELAAGSDPTDSGSLPSLSLMVVSNQAPLVDGEDIAQLNEVGHVDPGGDQGHIWSNRPLQGQTFTTGPLSGGYLLRSVTLRNEENTINNSTVTFTVRIGTVDGNVFTEVASADADNSISYVPNDYMTFVFGTPVALDPNTLYGFMWDTTGAGFTTWANVDTEYPDGEGFSSGAGGTPDDNNLVFRGVDREFHLDIDAAGGPGGPMLLNVERFGAGGESIRITWESTPGRKYAIDSATDLQNWDFEVATDLEAAADTTSFEELIANLPQSGPEVYFRVRELVPPPALMDDFESGQGGWTAGVEPGADQNTSWEFGMPGPGVTGGPVAANSGNNCFGTNLDGNYDVDADTWLRSPAFDLAGAAGATLSFYHHRDIEVMFDSGSVRVLDASDLSELGIVQDGIEGTAGWEQFNRNLPPAALGKSVILEFRFQSDNFNTNPQAGWYIDDVEVTVR